MTKTKTKALFATVLVGITMIACSGAPDEPQQGDDAQQAAAPQPSADEGSRESGDEKVGKTEEAETYCSNGWVLRCNHYDNLLWRCYRNVYCNYTQCYPYRYGC